MTYLIAVKEEYQKEGDHVIVETAPLGTEGRKAIKVYPFGGPAVTEDKALYEVAQKDKRLITGETKLPPTTPVAVLAGQLGINLPARMQRLGLGVVYNPATGESKTEEKPTGHRKGGRKK